MRDTWWIWVGGVLAVAIALLLAGRRAASRRAKPGTAGRPRPPGKPGRAGSTVRNAPLPGEIWWADVPYEDGAGSKVRPCLVLRATTRRVEVLKITSQDQSDRSDHVKIPTKHWDRKATHDSFLDLSDPISVVPTALERKAGEIDAKVWKLVRRVHTAR